MLTNLIARTFTWVKEKVWSGRGRKRIYCGLAESSRGRDRSASPPRKRVKLHHRRSQDHDSGQERPLPLRVTPPPASSSSSSYQTVTTQVPASSSGVSEIVPEDDFSFPPVPPPRKYVIPDEFRDWMKNNLSTTLPTVDDYIRSYNKPRRLTDRELRKQAAIKAGIVKQPKKATSQPKANVSQSMAMTIPAAESSHDAEMRAAQREAEGGSEGAGGSQQGLSHKRSATTQPERLNEKKKQKTTTVRQWAEVLAKSKLELQRYNNETTASESANSEQLLKHCAIPDVDAVYRRHVLVPRHHSLQFLPPPRRLPKNKTFPNVKHSATGMRCLSLYLGRELETGPEQSVKTGIPAFRPEMLTDDDRVRYERMECSFGRGACFVVDNCEFRQYDIQTLRPGSWLNDNVINGYMKLLQMRDGTIEGAPSCHFCKSFLVSHIHPEYKYSDVRRWTSQRRLKNWGQSKECILKCDFIFFPVHVHNNHWVLVVADLKNKILRYYDSLSGGFASSSNAGSFQEHLLDSIRRYLIDEALDKLDQIWSETDFRFEIVRDMPQQTNMSDCGVYALRTAKELSGCNSLNFTAEEMAQYRILILKELSIGQLL